MKSCIVIIQSQSTVSCLRPSLYETSSKIWERHLLTYQWAPVDATGFAGHNWIKLDFMKKIVVIRFPKFLSCRILVRWSLSFGTHIFRLPIDFWIIMKKPWFVTSSGITSGPGSSFLQFLNKFSAELHLQLFLIVCELMGTHRMQIFFSLRWLRRVVYVAGKLISEEHLIYWYVMCEPSSINNRIASIITLVTAVLGRPKRDTWDAFSFPHSSLRNWLRAVLSAVSPCSFFPPTRLQLNSYDSLSTIQVHFLVIRSHGAKLLFRQFISHCEDDA